MILQRATDVSVGPDASAPVRVEADTVPQAPLDLADTGLDPAFLADLTLKAGYTVPNFRTEWAARRLHLPLPLVQDILEQLRADRLVEALGQDGLFGYRFAVTQRGRERATRLLEVSGYVGPAPVSLPAYTTLLERQLTQLPPALPEDVDAALSRLVLSPEAVQLAGFAAASGRSLLLFGPPGNGKTTLGRLLHSALKGELWIPHCIAVENSVIRIFDAQCHEPAPIPAAPPFPFDARWVRIRRPFLVVGGELTLDAFDLTFSPSVRYYEAPLHVKANGGLFLIDDFGRERVEPQQLINRWISPLEHQIDHLVLHTGQKIQIPLRLLLVLATNLDPQTVTDDAFLRRLGYRLQLGQPTPEQFVHIFNRYASQQGLEVDPALLDRLLERYRLHGRELHGCEPRDLIERARDICQFRGQPLTLNDEILNLAWLGYFGNA
jgi:predicted ATPase with chaperone activity